MAQDPPGAPAPARRLPGFLSAFGVRDFRLLWTGAFLSSVGTWTQDVALAWLIHTEFRNPVYLGLRSFASDAPLLALMLVGGAIADRIDRRRILLVSQVIQMALAAALGLLYVAGRLGIGAIMVIAFLTGLTQSQSAPTYQAMLTSVVPRAQIPNAVALNSLQFNLSRAIGPMIAGVLLARAGTGFCFAVNAASFLAVIVALLRMQLLPPAAGPKESLRQSLADGFRHVGKSPQLSALMTLAAAASFLGFPLITYLPVIADETLHAGAEGYSLLLSSFGVGAIVGAIATAQRGNRPGRGRLLLQALVAFSVATLLAVLSRWPLAAMAMLAIAGVSLVTAFSTLNSLVQELAPGELRGRVIAIYGLAFRGGMPVGSVVAGLLVAPLGAPLVIGGFCLALGAGAVVMLFRAGRVASL